MKNLATLCFTAGMVSILVSLGLWALGPDLSMATLEDAYRSAHRERWSLFVGLWAPTFLILGLIFEARDRDARNRLVGLVK